jgi:hypothetical protein
MSENKEIIIINWSNMQLVAKIGGILHKLLIIKMRDQLLYSIGFLIITFPNFLPLPKFLSTPSQIKMTKMTDHLPYASHVILPKFGSLTKF